MDETSAIDVLHVDDTPDFGELAADILEREDERITVQTATSASDGLEHLRTTDYDCVVSDYDMPEQNGIEFLERVRERYPDLPFILYTGKGSEEVASDAITAGVTDYLQKESGTDQYTVLANRITNVVESHRSRQKLADRDRDLRRYKQMINSMYEAACLYDEDGRFEIVNEYLASWYNTTRDALEGRESSLIPLIQAQAENGDPYQALLGRQRDQLSGEIEAEFPGHGHAVLEYRLTPLTVDGTVEGVVGVTRDVTEQKDRQYRLRETNRLLSTLFETLPVGVTVLDTEGAIVRANSHAEEVLGLTESEITDRTYSDPEWQIRDEDGEPVPPEDLPFSRVMEAGEPVYNCEHGIRWPDGRERWLSINAAPITVDDDGVDRIVATITDITDAREYEQAVEAQNERLEEFASNVSHDLRNPLSVATGQLELARAECDSDHLDAIERAHGRIEALVTDLLTIAREGEAVADREPVDLAAIAEDCWTNVETADATLVTAVDRAIYADQSRLKRVFENLVRNAVEHGGDDVTVTFGELDGGFYLEDDGAGIPEDERDDVFEAGYSTSDVGTGFGLSIVKQVTDAHGWGVTVTEGSEGGARFEVTGVEFVTE